MLPARHWLNPAALLVAIALGRAFLHAETIQDGMTPPLVVMMAISLLFGVHMVMAIGDADMPVVAPATDPLQLSFSVTRISQPTLHSRPTVATSSQHTLSHLAMEAIGLIETAILPLYTAERNFPVKHTGEPERRSTSPFADR